MAAFLKPPMLGVVLQTYGTGNAPNNRDDLITEIKKATHHGVLIINCTQCLHGPVVDQYATGKVSSNRRINLINRLKEGIKIFFHFSSSIFETRCQEKGSLLLSGHKWS